MDQYLIIDDDTNRNMVDILIYNCIYLDNNPNNYRPSYIIRYICISLDDVEYKLYDDQNIDTYYSGKIIDKYLEQINLINRLMMIFSGKSLIKIQNSLIKYVDNTPNKKKYIHPILPNFYSESLHYLLENAIMNRKINYLYEQLNNLSDKMNIMMDYMSINDSVIKK